MNDAAPHSPRPITESLDRITRSLGGPPASVLSTIFRRWTEIVGPAVATHAAPVSLHRGTLVVAVDQPAWATQLTYLEGDLKRRIAEVTGAPDAVERVRVSVRSTITPTPPPSRPPS